MIRQSILCQKRKNFIKIKENFSCEHCGAYVKGTGYTNHCPYCLWSKHVDLGTPGDRMNPCQGLMKPIGVKQESGKWKIVSKCLNCKKIKINNASLKDNIEEIIKLSVFPVST